MVSQLPKQKLVRGPFIGTTMKEKLLVCLTLLALAASLDVAVHDGLAVSKPPKASFLARTPCAKILQTRCCIPPQTTCCTPCKQVSVQIPCQGSQCNKQKPVSRATLQRLKVVPEYDHPEDHMPNSLVASMEAELQDMEDRRIDRKLERLNANFLQVESEESDPCAAVMRFQECVTAECLTLQTQCQQQQGQAVFIVKPLTVSPQQTPDEVIPTTVDKLDSCNSALKASTCCQTTSSVCCTPCQGNKVM